MSGRSEHPLANLLKRTRREIENEVDERRLHLASRVAMPASQTLPANAPPMPRPPPQAMLVLLCGLPAAGKSTLARQLLSDGASELRKRLKLPGVRVWHLCFDDVLARLQAERGATGFDPELWHEARARALSATRAHLGEAAIAARAARTQVPGSSLLMRTAAGCREGMGTAAAGEGVGAAGTSEGVGVGSSSGGLIAASKDISTAGDGAIPTSSAARRALAPTALDGLAACSADGEPSASRGWFDVVLVDDNMHYRSMRRAYYRVAREARASVCTLCLPIDTASAVARDAERPEPHRVGQSTITMMAETLQWPEPEKHPWEQGSITLAPPPAPLESDKLWDALAQAATRLVAVEPMTGAEAEARAALLAAAAAQTAESALHQLDLRLRKAITAHMRSGETQALPAAERAALGKLLSERKTAALQACKRRAQRAAPPRGAHAGVATTGEVGTARMDATDVMDVAATAAALDGPPPPAPSLQFSVVGRHPPAGARTAGADARADASSADGGGDTAVDLDAEIDALEQSFALMLRQGAGGASRRSAV